MNTTGRSQLNEIQSIRSERSREATAGVSETEWIDGLNDLMKCIEVEVSVNETKLKGM